MIKTITILGGYSRSGILEPVERIDMKMGDVVSIVGPTGSGKTTLINDLELFADASHATENFAPHDLSELSTKVWSAMAKVRSSKSRLSACLAATHLSWT